MFADVGAPSATHPGAIPFQGRPSVKAHCTVGRVARFTGIVGRYRATVGGAIVALALASGTALAFAAVVDRVATNAAAANGPAAAAGVSEAGPILPARFGMDPWYETVQARTSRSRAHVVDRWFDAPEVAPTRRAGAADRSFE